MSLMDKLLLEKKGAIIKKWYDLILDTYPSDTTGFLRREKDRFANPVGYTISEEIEKLYEGFVRGVALEKLVLPLETIIKIRAVQEFLPSQALSFVFFLKKVIREELTKEVDDKKIIKDLIELDTKIERLAGMAFDIYMRCKEELYEIRLKRVKAEREMAFKILERAGKRDKRTNKIEMAEIE